jgi:TPR repeat protein
MKKYFSCLNLVIILLIATFTTNAKEQEEKIDITQLTKQAEQGNSNAQFKLGTIYFKGEGVLTDCNLSIKWWKKGAKQNNTDAQFALGNAYESYKFNHNYKEALKWYKQAADLGHLDAKTTVGWFYHLGHGTNINNKLALQYWREASKENNTAGLMALGSAYYKGKIIKKNIKLAFKYIEKAAKTGNLTAQWVLGRMYKEQNNYKQAIIWLKKVAIQKSLFATFASNELEEIYTQGGEGVPVDLEESKKWGKQITNNLSLPGVYVAQSAIRKDIKKIRIMKIKATQGNKNAQYNLGIHYFYKKEYQKAKIWLRKSYSAGNKDAKIFWDKHDLWKYNSKKGLQ